VTESFDRRVWTVAFFVLCCYGSLLAGLPLLGMGDALHPADPNSEANALREVDGFRAEGLWHYSGLGNTLFNKRYPEWGFENPNSESSRSITPDGVYTHYPQGPEYLLYLAEALFGPHPVARSRILPLVLCGAAAVFFGFSLRRRFGPTVGWLVMLACLGIPAFYDANTSVHMLGYTLALLLVEIGVCVGSAPGLAPLAVVGFAQGWMSFDCAFLVILIPLALELAMPSISPGGALRVGLGVKRSCVAALGFVLAHVLHLCEVWAYYGSLSLALDDLGASARYRIGVDIINGFTDYMAHVGGLLAYQLFSRYPTNFSIALPIALPISRPGADEVFQPYVFRLFGMTLGPWWLLVSVGLVMVDSWRRRRGLAPSRLLARWCAVTVIGVAVSCCWWFVMPAHAVQHFILNYRHLFFLFFVLALFVAVAVAPTIERPLNRER